MSVTSFIIVAAARPSSPYIGVVSDQRKTERRRAGPGDTDNDRDNPEMLVPSQVPGSRIRRPDRIRRLMYQPSFSIFILFCEQAPGPDSIIVVRFRWRAVNPNISLRSPVSTVLIAHRHDAALFALSRQHPAASPPAPAVSPSSAKELMMYLRALSLI